MVEVIDGGSGIKIGSLLGEEATQSKRGIGFSARRGKGFCSLGCGRSGLSPCQPIDLVIITEDRDVSITPRGVEQMVSSNARQVAISGEDDDIELWTDSFDGLSRC